MDDQKGTELAGMDPSSAPNPLSTDKAPPVLHQPSIGASGSSKELAEFKHRLGYLRLASVAAALIHVLITLIAMIMGFSKGVKGQYMSESLVIFAFGCLNTCVFAFVETWRTLTGTTTTMELPSWNWHNDGFLSSVGNVFFLCFFAIPSLVIYILHSLGQQFFEVLSEQRTQAPALFGAIMFHLIAGFAVFAIDTATILRSTAKLRTFQNKDEDEKDEKDGKTEKKKKTDDDGEEEDVEEEEEDEVRPIEQSDKVLAILTLLFHFAFLIDLIVLSARNLNSGTSGSTAIYGVLLIVWIGYTIKARNMKDVTESWLLNFRLATILHVFAFLLFFWVALAVVLLVEQLQLAVFDSVQQINEEDSIRALLISLLVIFIFMSVAIYGVILYVHSRSMWSLDEIASLYLAAQLQAKLRGEEA